MPMSPRRSADVPLDPQAERELDALEAALRGEPVGPGHSDIAELAAALEELRATPAEEFAARLDGRAAGGFGRRARPPRPAALGERLRGIGLRRAMPALAGGLAALVVGTAVVVSGGGGRDGAATFTDGASPAAGGAAAESAPAAASEAPAAQGETLGNFAAKAAGTGPNAAGEERRFQDHGARITLATGADDVRRAAEDVFSVVGRYGGIVQSSQIEEGAEGQAGAEFQLLIPSSRLGPALADLSEIAEVRSREETTADITGPVVTVRERLRDARAEVEGLLKQLADADTDEERAAVKAQLEFQHRRVATLRSTLNALERRANLADVSLQIVTGDDVAFGDSGGGAWTITDAIDDAGRILAVAAGVALVSLAVIAPLALLLALVLLGRRAWVRQSRERALEG